MKTILLLVSLATVTTSQTVQAQTAAPTNSMTGSVGRNWKELSGYIARAADQIPESDYGFRPTPTVRTFAQLIGHLADGQFSICAAALNETPKAVEGDWEKKTGKAALSAAFKASSEYCARAYAQADAAGSMPTKLFGQDATRFDALVRNAVHDGEHYGNIVTYMRVKGMVPPSSQPAPAALPTP
ncbi:MAG: DinB family protein [Gemmatimonadales bacterium]